MFHDLTDITGTAFLGVGGLEMIMSNIHSNGLYVREYRLGMLDGELKELSALIGTELEVGLLDQVIHDLLGNIAPLMGSANDGKANRTMKAGHELIPGCAVFCLRAGLYQLLPRHRRIARQANTPLADAGNCIRKVSHQLGVSDEQ